jgi:hypothetical protein
MTPTKENNKSPIMYLEEMDIHEITDKEFRIIFLKIFMETRHGGACL